MRSTVIERCYTAAVRVAAVLVVLVGTLGGQQARAADDGFVIGPEMQQLLGEMLGLDAGELPGGCKLDDAKIKLTFVSATYLCGGAKRGLELHHLGAHTGGAAETAQFVLVVPKQQGAPAVLVAAVKERILAREGQFHWSKPGNANSPDATGPTAPRPPEPSRQVSAEEAAIAAEYDKGFELFKARRHPEALVYFLDMAKRHPEYAGVLGMVVANLAPTQPDAARVAAYGATADANPADPLAQFVAGVAAHYSAHYKAANVEEKRTLYRTSIKYLERARPAFDFEPRVFIYLAVSHYRLGEQDLAETLVEQAVALKKDDPDAYYCRAEIWHRKDPDHALADIQRYMDLTDQFAAEGDPVAPGKIERVKAMRDYLLARKRGDVAERELWDPLQSPDYTNTALGKQAMTPRRYARLVGMVAGGLTLLVALAFAITRLRRRRTA